jgi:hypothetical protein
MPWFAPGCRLHVSKCWKRNQEIFQALENLAEIFPGLGKFRADFSEPRKMEQGRREDGKKTFTNVG